MTTRTHIRRLKRHIENATTDTTEQGPQPCEPPEGRDGQWLCLVGRRGFHIYLPAEVEP